MRMGTVAVLSAAVVMGAFSLAYAGGDKECSGCPTGGAVACETAKTETVSLAESTGKQSFEAIKALAGKWQGESKDEQKPQVEFKVTSGGSMVMETMFPGTDHEMINCYHLDGENVILTHYCAQGVQPRMKLASSDGKTMKFDFLDCTNLPSKDTPHMHDMTMTIDGGKISESWGYFKDGKVENHVKLEMSKQTS